MEIFDLGCIDFKELNDKVRQELVLKRHFYPPQNYDFPCTTQQNEKKTLRYASHQHLEDFKDFLVYSHAKRGYYCLQCSVMFNGTSTKYTDLVGYNKTKKKPVGKLNRHRDSAAHKYAVQQYANLKLSMTTASASIEHHASDLSKEVKKHKHCFKILFTIAVILARQAISFRGHRDSGKIEIDDSSNEGNWR